MAIAAARPAVPGLPGGATSAGIYREAKLGLADDLQDSNGQDNSQFLRGPTGGSNPGGPTSSASNPDFGALLKGPYTVAQAMADYLDDYRRRGGKASDSIESVGGRNILPELGTVPLAKLTTRRLLDWHRGIAERPRIWRSRTGAAPNLAPVDHKDAECRAPSPRHREPGAHSISRPRLIRPGATASPLTTSRGGELSPSNRSMRHRPLSVTMTRSRGCSMPLAGASAISCTPALLTGCRYGELCRLKVGDYNGDVGTLAIREAKSGNMRHVTLTVEAPELIERLIAGRPIDEASYSAR